jgi:tricorn protease
LTIIITAVKSICPALGAEEFIMKKTTLSLACFFFASLFCFAQTEQPLLLRKPTISKTNIAFVYAGDLWIVGRDGGAAQRLTTGLGNETDPQFSPDGSMIAFTGEYDGNVDVFVMPATGGEPKRLTFHPGNDLVKGWTNDGKQLLFVSQRSSESGSTGQLFTIPVKGGLPALLQLPMAVDGAYSPDGTRLAYEPLPRAFAAWKRYRGGRASALWLASLSDSSVEKLPRIDSNDFEPMWLGSKVYFLSDRNGAVTLFSYDTTTKKVTQEIAHNGLDIKSAAATSDAIVYEQFGALHLFDLKTANSKKLNITVASDQLAVRARYEKLSNQIRGGGISPTGARAVFAARGEIFTVPAEKGSPRNLTNSSGIAERNPAWSPNGRWIAYFSDESGEYALHLKDQLGAGEVKKLKLEPSFYYSPVWSPDSKKIAFTDKRLNLWYVDIEKGQPVKVDTSRRGNGFSHNWSPDSRWLAYTKPLPSWFSAVFVYSLADNKSTQVTEGLSDARTPVFDTNGKHLYFTASTDIGPAVFGFDMNSYPHRPTRSVYVAVLKKSDPSPLAPESDEEKLPDEEKTPEATAAAAFNAATGTKPNDKPVQVTIDFDNIGQRILALPIPAKNYVGLDQGKANSLYIAELLPDNASATIHKFDLSKRKLDKVLDNVSSFEVSANGEKMLFAQAGGWFIAATATPVKPGEGKLKTEEMEMQVDPRAEWTQMYRETWRIERDFFYDPNHHGLDLKATEKKYEPYLQAIQHRADLNYLFQEMLGELSVGHLYVQGGDVPDPKRVPGGLLGGDYKIENGRYRFARVYNGENWNPSLRAPLTQPGVNVVAGEYLLAVNGKNLTANDNVYQALEATANKQVVLRVGPNADGTSSREVTVVPLANEGNLRNLAWIEDNRRKVDQLSGGKLGYVWLPNTAQEGYTNFNRYYFAQLDKQGAVIDERFNGGGHAADYIIEYLKKPLYSYWAVRDGDDFRQPFGTLPGPKAMLVNEYAGSGGDYLPWMFRREKIGPLIGKRTWGGLVGIGGYPVLMDGGSVTAPHFAFYSPEGKWEIENYGVAPDIEVELDPKAWRAGRDPQLEKAVEVLLATLAKNPPKRTPRPAYPNYHAPTVAAEKPVKSEPKAKPGEKAKVADKVVKPEPKVKTTDKVAKK